MAEECVGKGAGQVMLKKLREEEREIVVCVCIKFVCVYVCVFFQASL